VSPIELSIFVSRIEAICTEMGTLLRQAAFSPNIKDRLDYSCALFDRKGALFAQAAHIPVHLGSMAYAMASIVDREVWRPGDVLVVNDPYLGGTHLPDVTVVSPCFVHEQLMGFVANRAHHANIGSATPGSMPIARHLEEEGLIISPTFLYRGGERQEETWRQLQTLEGSDVEGDFAAQVSANRLGLERLSHLIDRQGCDQFSLAVTEMNEYGERLARNTLGQLPAGCYCFEDVMDDDGVGSKNIPIRVAVTINADGIEVDFQGTGKQVGGNINCPLPVAAAAVFYVFRCLLPEQAPACDGIFRFIKIKAPLGCLVNAESPAAVAAGNVETSMRIVDAVLGALAEACPDLIPAASQGTMNNVAMGNHQTDHPWDYYETIGGGIGASCVGPGADATQSHMTNTLNTPIESLESHYPLRITRYEIRRGSGGAGRFPGGDGLIREFEFLSAAELTILSERRIHSPWGLSGGGSGKGGSNLLDGIEVDGKVHLMVQPGQRLTIQTPGGGGFGEPDNDGDQKIRS